MAEFAEIIEKQALSTKLSRRENARKRRTEHEKAYRSVQNPCNLFSVGSVAKPDSSENESPTISPDSSGVERVLGKDEASGSRPLPGTTASMATDVAAAPAAVQAANEAVETATIRAMKTTARGSLSEAEIMLCLARLGASVFTPAIGHDHPFDVIAHWGGHLSRIQIKTMRDDDSGSIVMAGASVVDRVGGKQWPVITEADCDVIVGWYPTEQRAYAIRPQGKSKYTFRRSPPKNNQIIGIWFEQDFRLRHLDQLLPNKNRPG